MGISGSHRRGETPWNQGHPERDLWLSEMDRSWELGPREERCKLPQTRGQGVQVMHLTEISFLGTEQRWEVDPEGRTEKPQH